MYQCNVTVYLETHVNVNVIVIQQKNEIIVSQLYNILSSGSMTLAWGNNGAATETEIIT